MEATDAGLALAAAEESDAGATGAADGVPCCITADATVTTAESLRAVALAATACPSLRFALRGVFSSGCFVAAFTPAAPTTPTAAMLRLHAAKRTMARCRRSRASRRAA